MARSTDPVSILISEIASEYEYKFKRGFSMGSKNDHKE